MTTPSIISYRMLRFGAGYCPPATFRAHSIAHPLPALYLPRSTAHVPLAIVSCGQCSTRAISLTPLCFGGIRIVQLLCLLPDAPKGRPQAAGQRGGGHNLLRKAHLQIVNLSCSFFLALASSAHAAHWRSTTQFRVFSLCGNDPLFRYSPLLLSCTMSHPCI